MPEPVRFVVGVALVMATVYGQIWAHELAYHDGRHVAGFWMSVASCGAGVGLLLLFWR